MLDVRDSRVVLCGDENVDLSSPSMIVSEETMAKRGGGAMGNTGGWENDDQFIELRRTEEA
jgi:hypothetical protein